MEKTVKIEDIYEWLTIMKNPQDYDKTNMYWRFSGALDILNHLGLISWEEKNKFLDEYLAETGA